MTTDVVISLFKKISNDDVNAFLPLILDVSIREFLNGCASIELDNISNISLQEFFAATLISFGVSHVDLAYASDAIVTHIITADIFFLISFGIFVTISSAHA